MLDLQKHDTVRFMSLHDDDFCDRDGDEATIENSKMVLGNCVTVKFYDGYVARVSRDNLTLLHAYEPFHYGAQYE